MIKITKLILLSLTICLGIGIASFSLAQDSTNPEATDATTDEQVSAQDLGVSDPTLLPNSPFYFLKEWARSARLAFTFNDTKKAELESNFSNEKLVEIRKMTEDKIDPEKIKKAVEKYQKSVEKIKNIADKIKDKAKDNPDVNKFLEKFTNQQVLQEKILQKLETQVPEAVLEKIKAARETHLEKFQQVMTKLEDNKDNIAEKVKNALQNGDEINSEILEKIKGKMPEDVRQKIEATRTEIINKVIEKVQEKNQTNNCPAIEKPSGDFCKLGAITVARDDKGCVVRFICRPRAIINKIKEKTILPNNIQSVQPVDNDDIPTTAGE